MKKFAVALIVASAAISGAVAVTTLSDQPAKADARVGIDLSQMMANAKNLPVARYDDYTVVFN